MCGWKLINKIISRVRIQHNEVSVNGNFNEKKSRCDENHEKRVWVEIASENWLICDADLMT